MATRRIILRGADIITPDRVITEGSLVIEDGRIAAVLQATPPLGGEDVLWVTGLIAPGLIDLHSDALEKEIRPRPTAAMPLGLALMEFDRKLAGHGICTVVHAVSFTETDGNARAHEEGEVIAGAIGQGASDFLVRHLVQARYEITDMGAAPAVHRVINAGLARMVSFMDHAPGGRQFKTVPAFVAYYTRALGLDREVVHRLAKEKHRRKREEASRLEAMVAEVAASARRHGALLASHDDEAASHVAWAQRLGVTIAEFPVSVEAVAAAKAAGLHVVMGAPNLLRGGSASGNLSVLEVFRRGLLDGLCSDYYPASLLHAVVDLVARGQARLPEAFRLVTLHPAQALGMDAESGSLEPGKRADVVVIGRRGGVAVITRVLRAGDEIYVAGYQAEAACVAA